MNGRSSNNNYSDSVTGSENGIILEIIVRPGSKKAGISGFDTWRQKIEVKVHAPPSGGAANDELTALIADFFKLPPKNVRIITGKRSKQKKVMLTGIDLDNVRLKLDTVLK